MVYIISFIIWGVIWGFATQKVVENKGYDENWFWWGFFFGFIALLVALSKSEKRTYSTYSSDEYTSPLSNKESVVLPRFNPDKEWKCQCGRTNANYVGTCACGRTKMEVESINKATEDKAKVDVADELKKFKELLDMGAITQEEFDAKKKQLLGL